jgi:hypothetical protein
MGRDQDHPASPARCRAEKLRHVEPALLAEPDVDEDDIGVVLLGVTERVGTGRCDSHHGDPLALQQGTRRPEELGIVVNDHGAHSHRLSMPARSGRHIAASGKRLSPVACVRPATTQPGADTRAGLHFLI